MFKKGEKRKKKDKEKYFSGRRQHYKKCARKKPLAFRKKATYSTGMQYHWKNAHVTQKLTMRTKCEQSKNAHMIFVEHLFIRIQPIRFFKCFHEPKIVKDVPRDYAVGKHQNQTTPFQ